MSTTLDALRRLFTSYGNAMYRNDPHAAEVIAGRFESALSETLALTRCACGDSFTADAPGKCVNCRAADGESLADKVQPAMTDQQATLLNAAHDMLLEHADAQRALGNDSAAASAECSADAVLTMAAAWSAAPPVAPAAPVAPQEWRARDRNDLEPGAIDLSGPTSERVVLLPSHRDAHSRMLYALASAMLAAASQGNANEA